MGRKGERGDRLHPDNCNIAKCKSCIFGADPVNLSTGRMVDIQGYLAKGEASHICHTTGKTCHGALEFQAKIFHAAGIIPEPTVDCLLSTASKFLGFGSPPSTSRDQDGNETRSPRRGR